MKNKLLSIILALSMLFIPFVSTSAAPIALSVEEAAELSAETAPEQETVEEETVCYTAEDGITVCQIKPVEETASLSASLPKLPKPTDLRWNEDWSEYRSDSNPYYGFVSWKAVEDAGGEYIIELFCDGEKVQHFGAMCYDDDGNGRVGWDFPKDVRFSESGKYTFKVTARGDGNKYSNSDTAESAVYNFVAPNKVLKTPENVRWDGNRITHTSVENASDYVYYVYNQKGELEFSIHGSGKYPLTNQPEITGFDMSNFIDKIIPNNYPSITKIYVSVIAITYDITKYQNSDESTKSDAKVLVEHEEDMTSSLENALSGIENGNVSAEEALDEFKSFMEESGSTNVDLALTMMKDSEVAENIDTLEEKFIEQTGVEVEVKSTAQNESYLADRGIDVNDISVKGAALNSDNGANVSLNFSEADSNISADENYYKNSVAVNIGMDGVKNEQKLDIPVIIEMPVPTGVVPHRLFILHYHADGSYEQIQPSIIYKGETPYARFILTSFSDFIFCNAHDDVIMGNVYTDDESSQEQANLTIKDVIALSQYVAGTRALSNEQLLVANLCTDDDVEGATVDVNINEKDVEALAEMLI